MAGTQSHYEINVSRLEKRGQAEGFTHFFATAERSVVTDNDLQRILPAIRAAFPEPLYKVDVTYWKTEGTTREYRPERPVKTPARALRRAYVARRGGRTA